MVAEDAKSVAIASEKSGSSKDKRVLRVDQIWSRKLRQHRFIKTEKNKQHDDRFSKHILVVRRIISSKGLLTGTEIDIRSSKLAEIVLEIFNNVEGLALTKSPPSIDRDSFFHVEPGLSKRLAKEKQEEVPDAALCDDIALALDFFHEEYASLTADLTSLVEHGDITYDLLWALFPFHIPVFSIDNTSSEPQLVRFSSGEYKETNQGNFYLLRGQMINHDGVDFGWGSHSYRLNEFGGSCKIRSLAAYPFEHHPAQDEIRAQLLERGRKYVSLVEPKLQEYTGLAVRQEENVQGVDVERLFRATGRVMIDPPAFGSRQPNASLLRKPWVPNTITVHSLKDEDLVFCNHRVLGFSLVQKEWGAFAVSQLAPVVWNEAAFKKLIFEEEKRDMIKALVQAHRSDVDAFDDIVAGKGKGLVGLLSGSPGVGKTLTAEVVAELSKRPLYMISAGELGTTAEKVDTQLGMVLDITRRWGCVLLIDEADVFLWKRGDAQLERNALVSIFLRKLEYFQGIVILTTNRLKDIDEAFKSRIHFSFHYPQLSVSGRKEIWKTFLMSSSNGIGHEFTEDVLEKLAQRELNGREIKNAVSCAVSIARANDEPLTAELVAKVLRLLKDDDMEN